MFFGGKTTNFVIEAIFKFRPKIVKNGQKIQKISLKNSRFFGSKYAQKNGKKIMFSEVAKFRLIELIMSFETFA